MIGLRRRTRGRESLGKCARVMLVVALVMSSVACQGVMRLDWTKGGRERWQRPAYVVELLEIQPGDHVADIGAGEGYFDRYLAQAVGPEGRVYAVEVDEQRVAQLEEALRDQENVEVIQGRVDDPLLPDGRVDLILLVNTYHHIADREAYFRGLQRDLASGGRIAIIEPNAELSGVLGLFVEYDHASRAADLKREMHAAGYRLAVSYDHLPVQIFEVFVSTSNASSP